MNILILSFYYPPDLCAGSFRTEALVNALKKKLTNKDKITVITTFPNRYNSFEAQETMASEFRENLEIIRIKIPGHKSGILDQAKSFATFFRKAIKHSQNIKHDVVFATSSRLFTAFLGANISKKYRTPLYLDIRDIFIDTMHSLSKPIYYGLKPFLSFIERYTFNQARKVNLVSKGFESYFGKKYPHLEYNYFTNGIDPVFLNQNFELIKKEQNKVTKILYAGNIGQGQGLHYIIPELSTQLTDNYLIEIIGDGGAKSLLIHSIEQLKIKNITLSKPIERSQLIEKYKSADILFLHLNDVPAFKKVLPSKIFEYAATGKPILAGVSGYCKEFIDKEVDNAEVFYPNDVTQALQAIKRLEIKHRPRNKFIEKYLRINIMDKLSDDILSII